MITDLITLILLSILHISCFLNLYVSTYSLVPFSEHIREVVLCNVWLLTQRFMTNQNTKNNSMEYSATNVASMMSSLPYQR